MKRTPLTVYIGYDAREEIAYEVAASSLRRHASYPVNVQPLRLDKLEPQKLITRPLQRMGLKMFDRISEAPQSTEFAASRFLAPLLHQEGWAIFVDCDVIFMRDVYEILPFLDDEKAVACVQHKHEPTEFTKMDGQDQTRYQRKNWSSFFAFNASHPANRRLTYDMVNTLPGRDLHRFCWLVDSEIGELPAQFNWLVNVQPMPAEAAVAHFTLGGPWFKDWLGAESDELWLEELAWHSKYK